MAVASEQRDRARFALADVAWAYLRLLKEGDFSRASQALAAFQSLYSSYRASVVAGYAEADRARVDQALPSRITPSGAFDLPTRKAMTAVLRGWFGDAAPSSFYQELLSASARDLPRWYDRFGSQVGNLSSALGAAYDTAIASPPVDVAASVGGEAHAFVLGLEAPTEEAPDTRQSLWETEKNQEQAMECPAGTEFVGFDEQGRRICQRLEVTTDFGPGGQARWAGMPTWGWVALGIGGVTAAGVLAYTVWSKG